MEAEVDFISLLLSTDQVWTLSSPEKVGRRVFKISGGGIIGHLVLLIGLTQRKDKLSPIFRTGGSFTTWSKVPTGVGLLPFHRDGVSKVNGLRKGKSGSSRKK